MREQLFGIGLALSLVSLVLAGFSWLPCRAENHPVKTVSSVDLQRYMGKWYEIAVIPMFFERKCVGNATANYALLPDGLVKVTNSCDVANGKRMMAEGRGKVMDPKTNAKLKVTFLHLLGWRWFAGGDYWITGLDPEYSYAIIGHPKRKYGWILSRTPMLSKETLQQLSKQLEEQGYDPCDFDMTVQKAGLDTRQPLCKVVAGI